MPPETNQGRFVVKPKPGKPELPPQTKLFLRLSWYLWGISLLLPGLWTRSNSGFAEGILQGHAHIGIEILLLWGPFAWIAGGFAVYANIFYWIAQCKVARGKSADISVVCMLALGASAFLVKQIPINEAGHMTDIAEWGCGVFVWDMALILSAAAAWDKRPYHSVKKSLLPYAACFSVAGIVALLL